MTDSLTPEPSKLNLWARQWRAERIKKARAEFRERDAAWQSFQNKDTDYARSIKMLRDVCAQVLAVWESSPVDLPAAADARTCTCHPDDNPPRPCPRKFSFNECVAAAGERVDAKPSADDVTRAFFQHIAQSKEASLAFLKEAGILDERGELAQPYRAGERPAKAAEPNYWANEAMKWRRKYAELRYPGLTGEVTAKAACPAPVEPTTFWLIERGPNQGDAMHWWWSRELGNPTYGDWTQDIHKATRFASKADAEDAARKHYVRYYAVASHSFMGAASPSSASASPASQPSTIERAADLLEQYAGYIREVRPADLERHPYLPELEEVAAELRALAASPADSGARLDETQQEKPHGR